MGIVLNNSIFSIRLSLTVLRLAGFWSPEGMKGGRRLLYNCYGFGIFMFLLGTYLIIQIVDLYLIWGNLPLMTGTAFVLFTNLAHAAKVVNILARKNEIQNIINNADKVLKRARSAEGREIIRRCDRETKVQQLMFFFLTFITTTGWASSPKKNELPLRAWYPYDTKKSPAYEITYCHQVVAIIVAAFLNVCKDTLVTSLIAQCRCRLRLVGLSLKNLCNEEYLIGDSPSVISLTPSPKTLTLTPVQEDKVKTRLRACVMQHQEALKAAQQLQQCFSEPTFGQFAVSLVIICVTAFQLFSQTSNLVRLFSMGTYLLNMTFQVFLYCYQGHQLSKESEEVAGAAYDFPWYACGVSVRRSVIILMRRCRRVTKITAGGFTTLSLASFMAIIKSSYSMFTLLQQVNERN
nr:odorant receptor Or1-like [Vanessa tameamea]